MGATHPALAEQLAALPLAQRQAILAALTPDERDRIAFSWEIFGRPNQFAPPGDWSTWLIQSGRGWGKTRTGAEFVRREVEQGRAGRVALVARTAADARDTMIEGESGILAISPPWFRPEYEPSKRRLTWPNGAVATAFSGEEPDALRGPQHDLGWCDEAASWKYAQDTWDMYQMGLRLGLNPRTAMTTTPRPIPLIRDLVKDATTVITRGSTKDNRSNLAAKFLRQVVAKYEGTRLGRQELEGEILDDNPNALWQRSLLDKYRVKVAPQFRMVVVAVDPAVTTNEDSDETGIVVAGLGFDGHAYVLADESGIYSPVEWTRIVVGLYRLYEANHVVVEVNNGGDLVTAALRTVDKHLPIREVRASRGKAIRAEPISSLYEQGRVHHVGSLPKLEDQLCDWDPKLEDSPDRLDAAVWALTDLMLGRSIPSFASIPRGPVAPRRM